MNMASVVTMHALMDRHGSVAKALEVAREKQSNSLFMLDPSGTNRDHWQAIVDELSKRLAASKQHLRTTQRGN